MTPRQRLAAGACACIVALCGLPACGGDDEPKTEAERVQQVNDDFHQAFSGGDYGKACDLMHSRRKTDLEFEQNKSCEDILGAAAETGAVLVDELAHAKTTNVTINGDSATVDMEGGRLGPGRQAILERDGDEWRVSEAAAGL
jgi:hypothetical protein